jgi:hypothetical protein
MQIFVYYDAKTYVFNIDKHSTLEYLKNKMSQRLNCQFQIKFSITFDRKILTHDERTLAQCGISKDRTLFFRVYNSGNCVYC